MRLSTLICSAVVLVSEVSAHGYVPWIRINGQTTAGWDITKGDQLSRVCDLAYEC